jgi:hypothetical protein
MTASSTLIDGMGNSAGCACQQGTHYVSNSNCLSVRILISSSCYKY